MTQEERELEAVLVCRKLLEQAKCVLSDRVILPVATLRHLVDRAERPHD